MTLPSPPLRFSTFQVARPQPSERARLPPGQAAPGPSSSYAFVPLESILPRIGITKQTAKKLEAIQLVREQREKGKQELAYHARPFVLCGIPLRRPPVDVDFVHLPKDGVHYRRIIQGFQRIFAASIFFGTEGERAASPVFDWTRFHFFDRMELWFNRTDSQHATPSDHPENTITLSESFYDEINQHPIPVERHVVASLANAPGLLDFYVWIVWKSWTSKSGPSRIPITGPQGLQGQLGVLTYSRNKRFRQTLRRGLARINLLWPECSAELSSDGKLLIVHASTRAPAIRPKTA